MEISKKKKQNKWNSMVVFSIGLLLLLLFEVICFNYCVNKRITKMEETICNLENKNQAVDSLEQTEYLKAIEYLETETTKFREFVEKQQDYLIWLIGLVGTGFLTILSFLGIENRKKISELFKEQYKDQVESEITEYIGGQKKVEYLMKCIEKEKTAKSKKILFLLHQEVKDKKLDTIYTILQNQEYAVQRRILKNSTKEEEIGKIVDEYDVVIYRAHVSELADEKNSTDTLYAKVSRKCNEKEIYGILYYTGRERFNEKEYNFSFYISIANQPATLLERLNNVLYFIQ